MDAFPHLRCTVEKVATPKAGKPVSVKFRFKLEGECRDRMIVKLYTGRYSQDIHDLDGLRTIADLLFAPQELTDPR